MEKWYNTKIEPLGFVINWKTGKPMKVIETKIQTAESAELKKQVEAEIKKAEGELSKDQVELLQEIFGTQDNKEKNEGSNSF